MDGNVVRDVGVAVDVACGDLLIVVWLEEPGVHLDADEEREERRCDQREAPADRRPVTALPLVVQACTRA